MGLYEQAYRFCPLCGRKVEDHDRKNPGSVLFSCPDCGFVRYGDPKLVVCSVLMIDHRILLVKRASPPQKGTWVLPGGYVDRGEELKQAAIREMHEECGLRVKIMNLVGLYSYIDNPVVLIVYQAGYLSGELHLNHESLEANWFPLSEIPFNEIAFQSTKDALGDFIRKINGGKEIDLK
jgi:ADP-ribose pyrophosphatase YjhB (NUDIX family)